MDAASTGDGAAGARDAKTPKLSVPVRLPGFTEPLDYTSGPLLPNALENCDETSPARLPLTTVREFLMLQFMNEVTDKPNWNVKVYDDVIALKWKQEAQQNTNFSELMADYCIKELQWRAKAFEREGFVFVYNGDVVKSDTAISPQLQTRLKEAVAKLEAEQQDHKDYHPNSDEKVWDLVHPSLFPLMYGTSRILRDAEVGLDDCLETTCRGEILPAPALVSTAYSQKFQWLPCDVRVTTDTSTNACSCRITSYINNLHPHRHAPLYEVLEEIVAAALPLWNESLFANQPERHPQRIQYPECVYDPDPEQLPDFPVEEDTDTQYEFILAARPNCLVHPEPVEFAELPLKEPPLIHELPLVERFASTGGLQVIVKLATIELTPEKPEYGGGVWHVEGQLNEHICATALYYYSSENITESRLAFRQMTDEDAWNELGYEQNDDTFLFPIFGIAANNEPSVQEVGSVSCREGRLVTFPNILQHRVCPFELADTTKPGHRKIVALFLVDPNIRIISTSHVPPQRQDWWNDTIWPDTGMNGLSTELHDAVLNVVDFPMSMKQAEAARLELMEERREFEIGHASDFESVTISLCEH